MVWLALYCMYFIGKFVGRLSNQAVFPTTIKILKIPTEMRSQFVPNRNFAKSFQKFHVNLGLSREIFEILKVS